MRIHVIVMASVFAIGCQQKDDSKTASAPKPAAQKAPARAPVQKATIKPKGQVPAKRVGPTSRPTSMPTSQPTSMPAARSGSIAGTIKLAPGLEKNVKAGQALFISARRDAGEGKKGMILAAKKINVAGAQMFPLKYVLTPRDVMMQGTVLAGHVRLYARLDQDGDAMSKQPGDVTGFAEGVKTVGDKAVDFMLDFVIPTPK